MAAEWIKFCRSRDLKVDGSTVVIEFGDDRRHCVSVDDTTEQYLLHAIVARQAIVSSLTDLPIQVWVKNRAVSLVGFRIDRRGRLVGEAWVPKNGVTAGEFQLYLRTLAVEADRFEYALTGRDAE